MSYSLCIFHIGSFKGLPICLVRVTLGFSPGQKHRENNSRISDLQQELHTYSTFQENVKVVVPKGVVSFF